jgi:hypothetical protein
MKLEQKNAHSRDKRIKFDEKNHIYFIDDIPYQISVTGFIKSFFQEFDSDQVIEKNYSKWQSNRNSKYYGLSIKKIKNSWKINAEDASKKGSKLHKDIEAFYNDIKFDNDSLEFNFFLNLNDRLKGKYVPYRTEWTIFDEEIKLAGSVDMCYTDEADNFYLFDWKRSKQIKKENNYRKGKDPISHIDDANYWHYALQLNIYKYIIEKNYGINISAIYLVRLHPDQQDYEVMNIPDLSNEVNSMLKTR